MTIAAAGTASNPMLLATLSQLSAAPISSTSAGNGDSNFGVSTATASANIAATQIATGPAKPGLTSEILRMLIQQQTQSGSTAPAAPNGSATTTDPTQTLFNAVDNNGDGAISQSELENYIEAQGGTQAQADQLFAQLDPNNTGSVSEATLANAAQGPAETHHHHHGHGMGGANQTALAMQMMQAMDSNGDGTVSQSEFTDYVTQNGGTSAQANALFTAFNTSGSGSLSQSDFQNTLQKLGVDTGQTAANFTAALANRHANPFGVASAAYSGATANTNTVPANTNTVPATASATATTA